MGWSGKALEARIDRLLPENRFEFVIASSEYMIRKLNPLHDWRELMEIMEEI
jgi:putative hydrolase of the HAD superfamily